MRLLLEGTDREDLCGDSAAYTEVWADLGIVRKPEEDLAAPVLAYNGQF